LLLGRAAARAELCKSNRRARFAQAQSAAHSIRMKRLLLPLALTLFTAVSQAADAGAGSFKGTAGLQLYSLRDQFKQDVVGTLDKVKAFGFTEVETAGTYGMEVEKFAALLKERGLKPVSGHFGYELMQKDLPAVIRDAKTLGVKYVACAWIPHDIGNFGEENVRKAAADFNSWGEAFKKEGITFAYHAHGYEFRSIKEGGSETLFDLMMQETKPEFVSFEMDVFWVMHPGKDPAELLKKYPNRWKLMHLKDIRKGARTGIFTGKAPLTDDVALGAGMVDWPAVLRAAAEVGVEHYFIEDESPTVAEQIPQSLKYLETLK
jgi:sugar phosphate isomerase/epimerase